MNSDGSISVYHGTSRENAEKILSSGILFEQSYFATRRSDAEYYAHTKHTDGVILELHIDARDLEFAAAGAELYSPGRLVMLDGIFCDEERTRAKGSLEIQIQSAAERVEGALPLANVVEWQR